MNYISHIGFKPLLISLVIYVSLIFLSLDMFANIVLVIMVFIAFTLRNSQRKVMKSSEMITSPIDGRVIAIDRLDDKIKITIESGILDISLIKIPIQSTILNVKKRNGLYISNSSLKSNLLNEQCEILLKNDNSSEVLMKILPGPLSFFGANINVYTDDTLDYGSEIGFMFQGRVELYIHNDSFLKIDIGDKLKATQSIIASI